MIPRTQTFSPSVFFIACGNDLHDRGNARSADVRMRSNFSIGGFDPLHGETPVDRMQWKTRVVLAPREPFLLDSTHGHAVDDECGSRIVIVRRDAEDLHVSTAPAAPAVRAPAR